MVFALLELGREADAVELLTRVREAYAEEGKTL
jgi:hypothetical protein